MKYAFRVHESALQTCTFKLRRSIHLMLSTPPAFCTMIPAFLCICHVQIFELVIATVFKLSRPIKIVVVYQATGSDGITVHVNSSRAGKWKFADDVHVTLNRVRFCIIN